MRLSCRNKTHWTDDPCEEIVNLGCCSKTFQHFPFGKLTSACHSHLCGAGSAVGYYSGQYSDLPSPRLIRLEGCGFLAPTSVSTVPSSTIKSQFMVTYGCESQTTKKDEQRRIDAFKLWCWRRLLKVPWTARRSNHSIVKEISPEYSLEGLMLKLKLQYFGHLMQRADSFEKTLMPGKGWRQEEKGTTVDEMVGWHLRLNGHEFE